MSHAAASRWSQVGGEGQAAEGTALPSHPTAWGCATEIRLLREGGGLRVSSQQAPYAWGLCKKFTSALQPDKEEQSEDLETNCEQMPGRIIRKVWKAPGING